MTITKEEFFKPGKMSAQDKASSTDQAARQIIASELAQRVRKTDQLRRLREAREADENAIQPTPVASAAKAKRPARKK